ncbi:hypothetical protein BO70DRAFT_192290 [Aspergillus heteromorphus CBS 117.55]|uniref:Cyclin-D1-binding protein 1-like N-terminal domain-containing protein n=1 Tax=Aspergillus heteromorphus CBS 117.55 TaxID=1448321 RepID=A0A317US13_9EURO|nr:uncharacterized protein BO70DRAFT_192290 [Aspergillus heteromorphus CBS 117.55]PWY64754.1 hypothetical protein BO70DRAFT_192290 [Aspergillus heteromorphus CBS 117.55]
MSKKLQITLTTSFTLLEQFQQAISSHTGDIASAELSGKDALPLLSASSTALRAQVTKLSLVTITSPFTPSAVTTVLAALNESVLPSLATAALLVTPAEHTKAFQNEVHVLAKTALKEIAALLQEVQVAANKKESGLSQPEKDAVTVAAGRLWDSCDTIIDIAAKGVVGFVVRRVEEWRDLVRDAVREIEEWDPDEEGDEFFDELLSDDEKNDDESDGTDDDEDTAALHAQKKSTLRLLKPLSQIYSAIIAYRLKKAPQNLTIIDRLESLMDHLQNIPGYVDEIAGALYEADLERSVQFLSKAKSCAVKAVDLAALPWDVVDGAESQQEKEDKFTVWSQTWSKVLVEVSKSVWDPTQST